MKYYQKIAKRESDLLFNIHKRVPDDGNSLQNKFGFEECPDYLAWVAEGNTAKEVDYTE